jgi:predicted PolB exonuclease-like 3'-5' exonuclease|tara:strand:+ start:24262 stop:25023 length:762 start_codon:yes stop_codon:yes gene_type:complete
MNILVFDIETVPDTESGAKILDLKNLSDKDIIKAMEHTQLQKNGSIFQPLHLHKIVTISVLYKNNEKLSLLSLGDENSKEKDILKKFFSAIDKYQPQLVSWNGKGFDSPVIHYRSLIHEVSSIKYWDKGEDDREFKWNNYLNRYHERHLDLMDVLSGYKKPAPLTDIAQLIGAPGKYGIDGSKVTDYYLQNNIKKIRDYCETDVLNTYFVFLRYQLISNSISKEKYLELKSEILEFLENSGKDHWKEFGSLCQ